MKSHEDWCWWLYIPPIPNDGLLYNEFLSKTELEDFFDNWLEFILKNSWRAYREENIHSYQTTLKKLYDNFEIAGKDWEKKLLKYNESRDVLFLIESISKLIEQKRFRFTSAEKNKLFNSIPSMLITMLRESVWIQQFELLRKDCFVCSEVCSENKAKIFWIINRTRWFYLEINRSQNIEELLKSFHKVVLKNSLKSVNNMTEEELYWFIRFLKYYKRVLLIDEQTNLQANTKNHSRSTIHTIILEKNMWQAAFIIHDWKVVWQYYWYDKNAIEVHFEDWGIAIPMLENSDKLNYVNPINGYSHFGVIESLSHIWQEDSELSFYFIKRNWKEILVSTKTKTTIWCEFDKINDIQLIQEELFLCWELTLEIIYIHMNSWIIFKNEIAEFKGKTFDFRKK